MNDFDSQLRIPRDHPSLPGHFPGHPIVPGVVLLDHVFAAIQAAADREIRLVSIVSTKFLQAVEPDTDLELKVKFAADNTQWKARFSALRAGAVVFEGSFLLTSEPTDGES